MTKASKVDEVDDANNSPDKSGQQPHRVRLPGFITGDEFGLGDVIKLATSHLGIQPCGGCERRAIKLNRWLAFTNRQSK
jgi:hypothetical protein